MVAAGPRVTPDRAREGRGAATGDAAGRDQPSTTAADQIAAVGPWGVLAMGAVFGGIAMIYNRWLGAAFLGACVGGCAVLLAMAGRVRRLSRWTTGTSAAAAFVFFGGLCVVGAAIAVAKLATWTLLWAALCFGLAAATLWHLGVRRREAEWEQSQAVNEGEVLDLTGGTYDVGRNFVYDRVTAPDAGAKLGRAIPWVAIGTAVVVGVGSFRGHDARELFLMIAGPAVFLGALPVLALVVTTWRKIRAYERRLGRDIFNR